MASTLNEIERRPGATDRPESRIAPKSTKPKLTKKASASDVLDRYVHDQVDALRVADMALRLDEPEAVHDLRVAVRRLRSCLRVFRTLFVPERIHPVATELAWLSDLLGEARDVEVLREAISTRMHALPDELVLGAVWVELDRSLAKPEARTMAAVREAIDGARYRTLLRALENLLGDRPYRGKADKRAKKVLRDKVGKAAGKVRSAVKEVSAVPEQDRAAALHNVRKKVKRLRYGCEVVEPVIGKRAKKVRQRSKDIQRTLGDHHDGVEARATLRELGARAAADGGNGFTFGVLYGQFNVRADEQERTFAEQWRRLAAKLG